MNHPLREASQWVRSKFGMKIPHDRSSEFDRSDIDAFFDDYGSPARRRVILFIFSLVSVIFSVAFVFLELKSQQSQLNPQPATNASWLDIVSRLEYKNVIAFVASGAISIVASLIAVFFINNANIKRLHAVRRLGRDDFLRDLFSILQTNDQRFSENKHIDFIFERVEKSATGFEAIICTLTFRIRTCIIKDTLTFGLRKLNRAKHLQGKMEYDLRSKDFDQLFTTDETDLREHFGDKVDAFYSPLELFVDSRHLTSNEDIAVHEDKSNGQIKWVAAVGHLKGPNLIDVVWKITIPFELPGYTYFCVDEPTRGFSCTLDYSRIKERVNVYSESLLDTTCYRRDLDRKSDGKVTISYDRWLMPNSSVYFAWYPRKEPHAPPQSESDVEAILKK